MLDCAGRSETGRRRNNEDAWFASTRLAAVADGVGGAAAGEVASATIINAIVHLDKCALAAPLDRALSEAVAWGNDTIGFIASCRPRTVGMSTTLSAVALSDHMTYVVANVGDSRSYLLRGGALTRLTRDDSFVQDLLDRGEVSAAEARTHPRRSLVVRVLDGEPGRSPALTTVAARLGDRLLVCSDGLSDALDDDTIAELLSTSARRAAADRLVDQALAAGARDNVSVVVADVVPRRDADTAWRG